MWHILIYILYYTDLLRGTSVPRWTCLGDRRGVCMYVCICLYIYILLYLHQNEQPRRTAKTKQTPNNSQDEQPRRTRPTTAELTPKLPRRSLASSSDKCLLHAIPKRMFPRKSMLHWQEPDSIELYFFTITIVIVMRIVISISTTVIIVIISRYMCRCVYIYIYMGAALSPPLLFDHPAIYKTAWQRIVGHHFSNFSKNT